MGLPESRKCQNAGGFFLRYVKIPLYSLLIFCFLYLFGFFFAFERLNLFPPIVSEPYVCDGPPGISVIVPVGGESCAKLLNWLYTPLQKYFESKRLAVFDMIEEGGNNEESS